MNSPVALAHTHTLKKMSNMHLEHCKHHPVVNTTSARQMALLTSLVSLLQNSPFSFSPYPTRCSMYSMFFSPTPFYKLKSRYSLPYYACLHSQNLSKTWSIPTYFKNPKCLFLQCFNVCFNICNVIITVAAIDKKYLHGTYKINKNI